MLDNFLQILPEVIFDAAEKLGGRCTGRFYALHALENRVYDIAMEEGPHVIIKFYRPGRWSRTTIQAEHDFLKALEASEIPVVCPLTDNKGQSIFEINEVMFTIFPKPLTVTSTATPFVPSFSKAAEPISTFQSPS